MSGPTTTKPPSERAGTRPPRRFVLGTAGHVDHGKTSLVRALTGIETDRLAEEQRRGITIELGFAHMTTGNGTEISVIDVPGHRKLVHTMVAGALGIECVLLVVAADEGVMPQTREHVAICQLLGVRHGVVALTKIDRVDPELVELAREDVRGHLEATPFARARIVPCSSTTGAGIDALRAEITRALEAIPHVPSLPPALLPLDRVFTMKGAGTVVTGTLVRGSIREGQELVLLGPAGRLATAARRLTVHGRKVDRVEAPSRVAVNLASVALDQAHRGDVVTDGDDLPVTSLLDVELYHVPGARRPLPSGAAVTLHLGTARTRARVRLLGATSLEPGATGVARLRLAAPLPALGGMVALLRGFRDDGLAGAVLGGGRVLDASPPRQIHRKHRLAALSALRDGDLAGAWRAMLEEAAPRTLSLAELPARLGVPRERLVAEVRRASDAARLLDRERELWVSAGTVKTLIAQAIRRVERFHEEQPVEPGMPQETLRGELARASDPHVAAAVLGDQATLGKLILEDGLVRSRAFRGDLAGRSAAAYTTILAELREAGLKGRTALELGKAARSTEGDMKPLLSRLAREGGGVRITDLWFDPGALDGLKGRVRAHLARTRRLTIAEFKDLAGVGRRQAIPLLEMLDREGITRRQGDDRVPGPAS